MTIKIKTMVWMIGLSPIAVFYYWLQWSPEIPVLGGDHAVYLLMIDHWSPFGVLSLETTRAAMSYSYFPPLYPMLLSLAGASVVKVELAHVITVTFFVVSLSVFFMVIWNETKSAAQSFLIVALFAFLPSTFFQSFGILSENLYLLLTLVSIWLLLSPQISLKRLYVASLIVGLALLTRTAGIALIIAFSIYLLIHNRKLWIVLSLLSLAPVLVWNALKWIFGYGVEIGYLWMLSSSYQTNSSEQIRIISDLHGIWVGWVKSFDPVPSMTTLITTSCIGLIGIVGCSIRIYQKRFDGIYVAIYLVMITFWLSSDDAVRYLYVITPLLLWYGLIVVRYPAKWLMSLYPAVFGHAYLGIILLTVLPWTGYLMHRLDLGTRAENESYIRSLYWYSTLDLDRARLKIDAYRKLAIAWKKTSTLVSEDDCIYSVDPTWLMLYSDRRSYSVPWVSTKEDFYDRATACRYVYVGSYLRPPFPLLYPKDYILDRSEVISVDHMVDRPGQPVLGMLLEAHWRTKP